ncbi:translation initiation factor IF-2 N-terminal domain-containing protein [Corynebacterium glucuronolyticum]|uniref:Ribonuclease E n=2 Tax=Corynebacterium glucuronolyticum TaxID=39791 RepID=A0AAX1LD24_9CORY|nr:translation initiation factor IF-2 N-terminal domain-containing protein [Corynebacterium glucuronolyticum]EEI62150.1 S1 RNA binding domain protein [Corynebacterium glucuronolyticum ATCC 51866]QRP71917.1 translation initiation factor IF-2 N-terminal domain-containing protein [Corynebacterium glucuronolyticum]
MNPDDLGDKVRVYDLARMLNTDSKTVLAGLEEIGVEGKKAQSSIHKEEAEKLLAHLFPSAKKSAKKTSKKSAKKTAKKSAPKKQEKQEEKVKPTNKKGKTDEEKLRYRVTKNVENEIHQIEEKVEKALEERLEDGADEAEAPVAVTPAPEPSEEDVTMTPMFVAPTFIAPEPIVEEPEDTSADEEDDEPAPQPEQSTRKRRRGRRGTGRGRKEEPKEKPVEQITEPKAIKGSTRLEAQRRRRHERRVEDRNNRHIVTESEFLARRESVERTMVVRERERTDHEGLVTQIGVLEDEMLVEHFVTSNTAASQVGNIYLGRVQNVLDSMEAAFIDIGTGRNGVLYSADIDWRQMGLGGRKRRIDQALKSGDQVLVQVSKDIVGHKGARLTMQISLAGRYLVYVPRGRNAGISRKLPEPERKRLKAILNDVIPNEGGAIVRTAAEGVSEKEIAADVERLHSLWEDIAQRTEEEKASKGAKPVTMYEEPDVLVRVVRDLFNEDFSTLVVEGDRAYNTVSDYVNTVAPDLAERVVKYEAENNDGKDVFEKYRIDEQLQKALGRKVWLPSGGTLIIDRTEAMTVIDVNTGKFTGSGGNLEETVTKNNLEAAEEIVRQMRLRDLGGMIVVDFIDMVLPENRDLVLRRLKEALGRDRTRHQVSEVTSLGLVQMTRKKLGTGLLETFATTCEACDGRGIILHEDPVEQQEKRPVYGRNKKRRSKPEHDPRQHPTALAMHHEDDEHDEDEHHEHHEAAPAKEEKPQRERRRSHKKHEEPQEEERTETYEEAKERFEKSPRRRRRTRGNSVSDHAPDPADFAEKKPEPEPEPEPQPEEKPAPKKASGRRRRAVRRAASKSVSKPKAAAKTERQPEPEADKPQPQTKSRRRRVARRQAKS